MSSICGGFIPALCSSDTADFPPQGYTGGWFNHIRIGFLPAVCSSVTFKLVPSVEAKQNILCVRKEHCSLSIRLTWKAVLFMMFILQGCVCV